MPDDAPADILIGTNIMDKFSLCLQHGANRLITQRVSEGNFRTFAIAADKAAFEAHVAAATQQLTDFKSKLDSLLIEFDDIMPDDPKERKGFVNLEPLKIEVDESVHPSWQSKSDYTVAEAQVIRKFIKEFKDWDRIEVAPQDISGGPNQKGWNSKLLVVHYDDKTKEPRIVLAAHNVNPAHKKLQGNLPKVSDITAWASQFKWLTKTDMAKGYWLILLHPESRKLYRFVFEGVQYQYKALPQGATVAPIYFQQMMQKILMGLPCRFYIDDVIIGSNSPQEHLAVLHEFFTRVRKAV